MNWTMTFHYRVRRLTFDYKKISFLYFERPKVFFFFFLIGSIKIDDNLKGTSQCNYTLVRMEAQKWAFDFSKGYLSSSPTKHTVGLDFPFPRQSYSRFLFLLWKFCSWASLRLQTLVAIQARPLYQLYWEWARLVPKFSNML